MYSQSESQVSSIQESSQIKSRLKRKSSSELNSESLDEQEYTLTKKNKKRQTKKKKKEKNPFQEKAKKQQYYVQQKESRLIKASQECQKMHLYLRPRPEVQAKLEPLDPNSNGLQNSMNSYIDVSKSIEIDESWGKGEKSLERKAEKEGKVKKQHSKDVKKEHLSLKKDKQSKIKDFLDSHKRQEKARVKLEQQMIKPEEIKSYSEPYYFVKSLLEEMLASKDICPFYKFEMSELMKTQGKRDYYHDYFKKIPTPLSLSQLFEMISNGLIKNFLHFKELFDQMLLNGKYYHMQRHNSMIIENGEFLRKMFLSKLSQLHPDCNKDVDDFKLMPSNKPKSESAKLEEDPEVQYLDLSDEQNQYRFTVMNRYLKKLCLENQQQVEVFWGKLEHIIKRYPKDKVELIRRQAEEEIKEPSRRMFPSNIRKSRRSLSPKSSRSQSAMSDQSSPNDAEFLEIIPKEVEVELFEQMKRLVVKELRHKNSRERHELKEFDPVLDMMYPHEDSDDFDIDDDSDDSDDS